ncbi:MAG: hypothetical protein HW402_13 [Dehalococcoidales bacterium]|nr:hypothetical protein [Dehalococcoidales bacterium]
MTEKKPLFFYGWLVVIISLLTVAISYGIRYSFSVFYVAILREFGWSRADTALVFSINVIVYGVSAPIAGLAIDRFGPRKLLTIGAILLAIATAASSRTSQIWHLYILFGVVASLGICVTGYVTNAAMVSRWFIKRRGTALGIFALGFAVAFSMSSGVEYLTTQIGWRGSFVALGFMALAIAPVIAIFQRLEPKEKGLLPDGESVESTKVTTKLSGSEPLVVDEKWASQEWSLPKALKTRRFWFLFLGSLFAWGLALGLILAHQVAFAVDAGYSRAFGALIFSLYGVCNGLGNLLGFLSDRLGREVTIIIGITLGIAGILMLILNQGSSTPWLMYAYSLLFGLGMGIVSPTFTASVADLFQGKNFGSINGFIVMGFGIGGAISPWLGGKIFDTLGTYLPAFYFIILALVVAAICMWFAGPRQVRLVAGKANLAHRATQNRLRSNQPY